jgi:polyisoprenyl-phosphate glycosyltransferase
MIEFELIFVDDGSTDKSADLVRKFAGSILSEKFKVRLIRFSRNFGHEAAMIAGIDHAAGDAVICMDADLQHPVGKIPEMISRFDEGYDIVTMIRLHNKGNSLAGNSFSSLFYWLFNALSKQKLQPRSSDFFLISSGVASILRSHYRERNRFLRGIIQTIGFRIATLSYDAPGRKAGKTSYSFLKLSSLTVRAITSFSQAPLRLGIWFGFLFSLLAIILGIYSLWVFPVRNKTTLRLYHHYPVP